MNSWNVRTRQTITKSSGTIALRKFRRIADQLNWKKTAHKSHLSKNIKPFGNYSVVAVHLNMNWSRWFCWSWRVHVATKLYKFVKPKIPSLPFQRLYFIYIICFCSLCYLTKQLLFYKRSFFVARENYKQKYCRKSRLITFLSLLSQRILEQKK